MHPSPFLKSMLFFFFFLNGLHTQHGTQTHNPEITSRLL